MGGASKALPLPQRPHTPGYPAALFALSLALVASESRSERGGHVAPLRRIDRRKKAAS